MTELTPEVIAAAERLKRNIATHQQEAAELTELREKLAESDLTIADCHHDMAAMNDELAELRAENERLKAELAEIVSIVRPADLGPPKSVAAEVREMFDQMGLVEERLRGQLLGPIEPIIQEAIDSATAELRKENERLKAELTPLRKLAAAEEAFLAGNGVDEITRRYCEVKAALAECKLLPKS